MRTIEMGVGMVGSQRQHWMVQSSRLAEEVADDLNARRIDEREIAIGFVARGGMLLFPAFSTLFPRSFWLVATCERQGGLLHTMHWPRFKPAVFVLVDAVAATGGTLLAMARLVQENCQPSELLIVTLSCTEFARDRFVREGYRYRALIEDTLIDGAPSGDLAGLDAGDLFQGIEPF